MSLGYFNSCDREIELLFNSESWLGTPFVLGAKVKGAGVDCVGFVAEVLRESGHLESVDLPHYSIDGGDHLGESLVERWLKVHPLFERVDRLDRLMTGDVLEFKIGRGVSHHVGIYFGGPRQILWSAMSTDGVRQRTLRDGTWGRRLVAAWRPIERVIAS